MNERIVINLDQTDTQDFETANLIQAGAQKSFQELIGGFRDNTGDSNKNKFERVHNTILINGKRGMGKTSFILSMQYNSDIMKELCPLEIIDPTLIETKEHVLLNIITLIKDKVEKFIKNDKSDVSSTKFKDWKESLKKLAGGLSMLDGVGSDHLKDGMWDSPELILEKGLSNAKQGVDLEKNFHKFIDESLTILGKKAFFLILDDIDTSLDKGSAILETLRKYLTSKKLIIAMLGDIDLYSTLVRQLQWEKMDPKKILKEYEFKKNKKAYVNQIEHLEEQYLTKVLEPKNRIDLKNLLTLKETLDVQKINGNIESFVKFIDNMINEIYLTEKSGYKKYYQNTLLTQSTRSILQILHSWDKNEENDHDKKNANFLTTLKHTFYTTIKKKLAKYNLIEAPSTEQFLNLLSVYILKENISRDNHLKLIPEFTEEDNNIAMFYINAMANSILDKNDYLAYFIKVGYAFEQFLNLEIKAENELEKFIDHIALDSGESSSKIAKRLLSTSYIHTNTHQAPILFGSIFINQTNLKSIDKKENISLLLSRVNGSTLGQYNFLSFFNLLGFMSDITSNQENIAEIILNNKQILEFVLYKDRNMGGEIDSDEHDYSIGNEFLEELKQWVAHSKDIQKLPLFVLAKIWVRTSYTFSNISKNKFDNYYQVLEMFVVGFLNAVYVETYIYSTKDSDNTLVKNTNFMKNPDKDPQFFYNKIESYKKTESKYTLYDYISECPLFAKENRKLKYFSSLEKVTLKIDFASLNEEERKSAIEKIPNWKNKANGTINTELSKQYKNIIQKDLTALISKINPKVLKSKVTPTEDSKVINS